MLAILAKLATRTPAHTNETKQRARENDSCALFLYVMIVSIYKSLLQSDA